MTNHDQVVACLDGSAYSTAVCDSAGWAAKRLNAPLVLLHAIYHRHATGPVDLSGVIGLGTQEALLEQLAAHDQQTGKLALERGRLLIDAARARVDATGGPEAAAQLLHGPLVDRLVELEPTARLVVIGKRGASAHAAPEHLGNNLERVVRALRRPILVVPADYREPASVMLAFDGSDTTHKAVDVVLRGPLFAGLPCHLVTAAEPGGDLARAHAAARARLEDAGFRVLGGVYPGDADTVLLRYQQEHDIGLVVMGTYGHSRIRHLLVGSTTTSLIRQVPGLLLLLR